MLEPLKYKLDTLKIILADSSSSKRDILHRLGLKFEILPPTSKNHISYKDYKSPSDYVMSIAFMNVNETLDLLKSENKGDHRYFIIGCHTVVYFENKVYGVPQDEKKAMKYLSNLSGRVHEVITGMVIATPLATVKFTEVSYVELSHIPENIIRAYIGQGEHLKGPAGYSIIGPGKTFIKRIKGHYSNLAGFPIHSFCTHTHLLMSDKVKLINRELSAIKSGLFGSSSTLLDGFKLTSSEGEDTKEERDGNKSGEGGSNNPSDEQTNTWDMETQRETLSKCSTVNLREDDQLSQDSFEDKDVIISTG